MTPSNPRKPGMDGEATPRPWSLCNEGDCKCLKIGGKDHPIAEVTNGDWGDTYPSVRLIKVDGHHAPVAEAFMDGLPYGNVPFEVAKANAQLIVEAVNNYDALRSERDTLLARCGELEEALAGNRTRLIFKCKCGAEHDASPIPMYEARVRELEAKLVEKDARITEMRDVLQRAKTQLQENCAMLKEWEDAAIKDLPNTGIGRPEIHQIEMALRASLEREKALVDGVKRIRSIADNETISDETAADDMASEAEAILSAHRRYAAGDESSPMFVVPGIGHLGGVHSWSDLGDEFNAPLWAGKQVREATKEKM